MSATACSCEPVSPKGRAASIALDQTPVAGIHPARQAPHAAAHEGEGELGGQQLVIGEAPARRRSGDGLLGELRRIVRPVQGDERLGESRAGRCGSSQAGSCHSGRRGTCRGPRRRSLPDHARGQALGQAVDGLDGRQARDAPLVEDPVRMDHLAPAVPELDLARRRSGARPAAGASRGAACWPLKKTRVTSPVSSSTSTR